MNANIKSTTIIKNKLINCAATKKIRITSVRSEGTSKSGHLSTLDCTGFRSTDTPEARYIKNALLTNKGLILLYAVFCMEGYISQLSFTELQHETLGNVPSVLPCFPS